MWNLREAWANVRAFDLCECAQEEKYIQMKYIMNESHFFIRSFWKECGGADEGSQLSR